MTLLGFSSGLGSLLNYSYDPDAFDYFNRVEAKGAAFGPDSASILTNKAAINAFFVGTKADGIFNNLESCAILRGITTLAGCLTPLKGSANIQALGGMDETFYSRTSGVGDITTAGPVIGTGITFTVLNDNHYCFWVASVPTGAAHGGIGPNSTAGARWQISRTSSNIVRRNSSSTNQNLSATAFVTGMIGAARNNSANWSWRYNGSTSTVTQTSSGTPNTTNLRLFNADGVAGMFASGRISFFSVGPYINLASLESRVSTLMSALV
jgi:hypothetical protein